ncbi:MAG: hypothetical protein KGZ93_06740 [Actinobacteria bacterium]|nr:hypothetical protein [Actinomycetota bacterium]
MASHTPAEFNAILKASQQEASSGPAETLRLRKSRMLFFALGFYLLAQAFMIPVRAVGPSWAIWPTLADIALLMLLLAFLPYIAAGLRVISQANKVVFNNLLIVFCGAALSYFVFIRFYPGWSPDAAFDRSNVIFGAFQLYRLAQFILIFWITAQIPLTEKRITVLRRIVDGAFIFTTITVVLTYFDILPKSALVAHLPSDLSVAGPWVFYSTSFAGKGWGTIGYNHAYVAAQLLMLAALRIYLSSASKAFANGTILFVTTLAIFMSGSRAGLAAALLFAVTVLYKKPIYIIAIVVIGAVAVLASMSLVGGLSVADSSFSLIGSTFERQLALGSAYESESLNGRDTIWLDYLVRLNEAPKLWVFGSGFGAAGGQNAHLLYLQIIYEVGLIGLVVFAWLIHRVLSYLSVCERGVKPLFWVTIAFLLSGFSQETFYPVPSFGHFLGFYLCSLAIALRVREVDDESEQGPDFGCGTNMTA